LAPYDALAYRRLFGVKWCERNRALRLDPPTVTAAVTE